MNSNLPKKILAIVIASLVMVLLMLYAVFGVIMYGPFDDGKQAVIASLSESKLTSFIPRLYLSREKLDEILADKEIPLDIKAVPVPIVVPEKQPTGAVTDVAVGDTSFGDGITVHDVKGGTYNGKIMVIDDPTRVFVGVPQSGYGQDKHGMTVMKMIEQYDAVAGTNAGGMYNAGGNETGGIPEGLVISNGELLWGQLYSSYSIAGLDANGTLHVGTMTAQNALSRGIIHAVSYGPALIVNGVAQQTYTGGLNPRTAIGQRADGAILLLVITGRSVDSLGATLNDVIDIFTQYGAVNATSLNGGSSSVMIHNGEPVTDTASGYADRVVSTSIIVK